MGVHGHAQALGVGELDQVEQQVVLGLQHASEAGKTGTFDQPCGWLPATSVDGVVGVAVPGVRRADLGRATEAPGTTAGGSP